MFKRLDQNKNHPTTLIPVLIELVDSYVPLGLPVAVRVDQGCQDQD